MNDEQTIGTFIFPLLSPILPVCKYGSMYSLSIVHQPLSCCCYSTRQQQQLRKKGSIWLIVPEGHGLSWQGRQWESQECNWSYFHLRIEDGKKEEREKRREGERKERQRWRGRERESGRREGENQYWDRLYMLKAHPSHILPPARHHFLKVPEPSWTVPPLGD